ncbi:Cytochrome c7 c [uncultured archaeon]|nr:Cytochrome c7 c [uncultured archaeon]
MKLDKKIIYVAIFAAAVMLLLIALRPESGKNQTEPEAIPEGQVLNQQSEPVNNYTIIVSKDVCEGCHMSGKPSIPQAESVSPHVNGGAYCLTCHQISHEIHPINNYVTCEKCHGTTPGKPVYSNGSISCNNCHDYPDPLLPSKGNLITVHRPRGVYCNNCHTEKCSKCHTQIGTSERWVKRMEHFKVVAIGYK